LRSALPLADADTNRRRLYQHNGNPYRVRCHKNGFDANYKSVAIPVPIPVTITFAVANAATVVLDSYRTMIND
jgi:hypothetical protein